jgi:hypothetical protein
MSKKEVMMELFIIVLIAIVLDIAALRRGFDSRDTLNSAEWGRRNAVSSLQKQY